MPRTPVCCSMRCISSARAPRRRTSHAFPRTAHRLRAALRCDEARLVRAATKHCCRKHVPHACRPARASCRCSSSSMPCRRRRRDRVRGRPRRPGAMHRRWTRRRAAHEDADRFMRRISRTGASQSQRLSGPPARASPNLQRRFLDEKQCVPAHRRARLRNDQRRPSSGLVALRRARASSPCATPCSIVRRPARRSSASRQLTTSAEAMFERRSARRRRHHHAARDARRHGAARRAARRPRALREAAVPDLRRGRGAAVARSATRSGVMVNENWRYRAYFRRIGEWLHAGRLGTVDAGPHRAVALQHAAAARTAVSIALTRQPFLAREDACADRRVADPRDRRDALAVRRDGRGRPARIARAWDDDRRRGQRNDPAAQRSTGCRSSSTAC